MSNQPLRPYSTKRVRPIPPEFEENFVDGGWPRVNHMYGKRPALRYFHAVGAERLAFLRQIAFRKKCRAVAAPEHVGAV